MEAGHLFASAGVAVFATNMQVHTTSVTVWAGIHYKQSVSLIGTRPRLESTSPFSEANESVYKAKISHVKCGYVVSTAASGGRRR